MKADAAREEQEQNDEINFLKGDLDSLNTRNDDKRAHADRLNDELASLRSQLNAIEDEIRELSHQIKTLEDEGEGLENQLTKLEDQLRHLDEEQSRLTSQVAEVEDQCADEERRARENRTKLDQLTSTRDSLRSQLERGDEELAEVIFKFNLIA